MVRQQVKTPTQGQISRGFGNRTGGLAGGSGASRPQKRILSSLALISVSAILLIGALAGGAYLVMRDDLMAATLARQARMQQAYEDRITALRAQVDIVTSRQLLDQRAVENRMQKLIARQASLGERQRHVRAALQRAARARALTRKQLDRSNVTIPSPKPVTGSATSLRLGGLAGTHSPFASGDKSVALAQASIAATVANGRIEPTDAVFDTVEQSLAHSETAQLARLQFAKKAADTKSVKLASLLRRHGLGVDIPKPTALGGPLIELKSGDRFLDTIEALDASLLTLASLRTSARTLPHGSPVPGKKLSSRYGARKDPFTGRRAMHGGLDFKAKSGTPVLATASGTVVKAGRSGGYGKLVEIDHGNGITSRYAHLSRILVKPGQKISIGTRIGKVGSTGRSTGPHLHYEIRNKGRSIDPIKFVQLGRVLKPYL